MAPRLQKFLQRRPQDFPCDDDGGDRVARNADYRLAADSSQDCWLPRHDIDSMRPEFAGISHDLRRQVMFPRGRTGDDRHQITFSGGRCTACSSSSDRSLTRGYLIGVAPHSRTNAARTVELKLYNGSRLGLLAGRDQLITGWNDPDPAGISPLPGYARRPAKRQDHRDEADDSAAKATVATTSSPANGRDSRADRFKNL